jgi:hypothetical protein
MFKVNNVWNDLFVKIGQVFFLSVLLLKCMRNYSFNNYAYILLFYDMKTAEQIL